MLSQVLVILPRLRRVQPAAADGGLLMEGSGAGEGSGPGTGGAGDDEMLDNILQVSSGGGQQQ